MKKWLALVTACAMTAAMTGLGETESDTTAVPEATATPEITATPTPEVTATPTPEVTATPTPEATATATPETTAIATPEATATATPEATATATPEATATATPETTATATPEATATATPEATATSAPEVTATPTPEATATAAPEVTATPTPDTTVTPAPDATEAPVEIPESVGPESPVEDILLVQGWLASLEYLTEEQATGVYDEDTQAAVTLFQTEMNETRQAGLEVTGLCDRATLELMYAQVQSGTSGEQGPGGFPGGMAGGRPGGFGGGGGSRPSGSSGGMSGGMAGAAMTPDLSATGGVTPGEAVTSTHESGDADTSAYGSVDVCSMEEASDTLTFGDVTLDLALEETASGQASALGFTAILSEDGLRLTLTAGECIRPRWTVGGMALRTLSRSGVETLTLIAGGARVDLPTSGLLTGVGYDALRSSGVTDNALSYLIALEDGAPDFTVMAREEAMEAALTENGPLMLTGVSVSPVS